MDTRATTDQQGEHGNGSKEPGTDGPSLATAMARLHAAMERAATAVAMSRELGQLRAETRVPTPRGRRPLAERLALHDARFRALVAVTGHVVWSIDADGRMTDTQSAWMTFTGQTPAQIHAGDGMGWADALHPDDREESVYRLRAALSTQGVFEHTARVQHRRGDEHDEGVAWCHMLMRAAPVHDAAGKVLEWVGVNTDVTDFVLARATAEASERAARQEAEHARDVAEAAWHRAEEATKAKGRMLAAASHDLRTPLSAIGGYIALLKEGVLGPLTAEQARALDRMDVAREHLYTLVGDILDAAHLESGQSRLDLENVPLGDVCTRLYLLTAGQATKKGQRFSCQVLPAADADRVFVRADRHRLQQILVNLVTNAVKYTGSDGEVRVDSFVSDDHVVIQVSDTGRGIPRDQLSRVFEPFVQLGRRAGDVAANDGDAREGGVGLGLATSLELARRMGGDVTVESVEGEGSTFTLVLPLAGADGDVAPLDERREHERAHDVPGVAG